jgi:phage-related holin
MSNPIPFTQPEPAAPSRRYEWSWARVVSDVFSPPVVWAALSFPLAAYADPTSGNSVVWALIYVLLVCVAPVVYIAVMVKRGHITDIHIKVRRQRIVPFIVTIVCAAIAALMLALLNAPALVTFFALFTMLQIIIMLVVTTAWQISIHALGIVGAVVAIGAMYGTTAGLLSSPLIPVVCAARVVLRRHTIPQVIAGGIVGGTMTALLFGLVG